MRFVVTARAKKDYRVIVSMPGVFELSNNPIAAMFGEEAGENFTAVCDYYCITLVRNDITVLKQETIPFSNSSMGRSMLVVEVSLG